MLFKHTLRNALIPVVTALGLILGQMLGGAVLTETVFSWPGIGRLTVFAIFNRDLVLVQGIVLILALMYVLVNLTGRFVLYVHRPRGCSIHESSSGIVLSG